MNKLTAILLVFSMVFCLAACGNKSNDTEDFTPEAEVSADNNVNEPVTTTEPADDNPVTQPEPEEPETPDEPEVSGGLLPPPSEPKVRDRPNAPGYEQQPPMQNEPAAPDDPTETNHGTPEEPDEPITSPDEPQTPEEPEPHETPDNSEQQPEPEEPEEEEPEEEEPTERPEFTFNFIELSERERIARPPAPPEWRPENYIERWDHAKVINYLGIKNLHPGYVPRDLSPLYDGYHYYVYGGETYGAEKNINLQRARWIVQFNANGRIWDYFNGFRVFYADSVTYTEGRNNRELTVIVNKGETPRYTGGNIIIPYEDIEESYIRGVDACLRSYGDSFYAEFMYNGNGYYIESTRLTEQEFTDVLLSIIL